MMPLLTPDEVASRWHCSKRSIQRLIQLGQVPVIRICGRSLFREEDLLAYESGHRKFEVIAGCRPRSSEDEYNEQVRIQTMRLVKR